jgi:hypothetical protein
LTLPRAAGESSFNCLPSGEAYATTRQFSWTPPSGTSGNTYNVKFLVTTPSGGSDCLIAQFSVHQSARPFALQPVARPLTVATANPVRDRFEVVGEFAAGGAKLFIYDLTGRRVAYVRAVSDHSISWDLNAQNAGRVPKGMYFYRAMTSGVSLTGKIVVM